MDSDGAWAESRKSGLRLFNNIKKKKKKSEIKREKERKRRKAGR